MKNELRKAYITERKNISDTYKDESGKIIFASMVSTEEYMKAKSIFIYAAMKSEVPTTDIIHRAMADGKTVALPVSLQNREMFFTRIRSLDNLTKTRLGVMEPVCTRKDELRPDKDTLLVVPGVAFDENGHRMGYGGGYYDTYIEKYGIENTAALAFDTQVKSSIPYESHDKVMNIIITEKRVIRRRGMSRLIEMGKAAKQASVVLARLGTNEKNRALMVCADALEEKMPQILSSNKMDIDAAVAGGIKGAFIDRLTLNEARVMDMADGLRSVARLDDPIGEVLYMKTLDNGLKIGQKRVPMGVIGIIFEARPNVTADAFGLCLKAGSAVILRGGKEAINSNLTIVNIFREALRGIDMPEDFVQIVEDTSRDTAAEMMRLNGYIDVLIPRGGAGLIQSVVMNSTVPVIETGIGNCHIYVDESADLEMAVNIVINAKTQRPGVCNACESLLVHETAADKFIPMITKALREKQVEIRGDESFVNEGAVSADDDDWGKEYNDLVISAKTVKNIDEAIEHIRRYGTGHSECIVTESYSNAQKFLDEVDAAAVYVNASTRFTDGGQFGFGAEIGISTQKLHARGPMGLKEITTTKYIIYGNGQIR